MPSMKGTMTPTFSASTTPPITPKALPSKPTSAPWIMKIFMMENGEAPSVRKMAMSACLSVTDITRVETRLNAATAMIMLRMMNIMFFWLCTSAYQLALARDQSRIHSWPGIDALSSRATCGAWFMSCRRRRRPDGPSSCSSCCASAILTKARLPSSSLWPASKMPATLSARMRGMTMPVAGSPALGSRSSIRVTFCPTFTSSALARSMPSTMLYEPGVRSLKLPCFI